MNILQDLFAGVALALVVAGVMFTISGNMIRGRYRMINNIKCGRNCIWFAALFASLSIMLHHINAGILSHQVAFITCWLLVCVYRIATYDFRDEKDSLIEILFYPIVWVLTQVRWLYKLCRS